MTKRRMMLAFLLCFLIGGVGRMTLFQACTLGSDSNRSAEMSQAQSKREAERTSRQFQLEFQRKREERRKEAAERKRQDAQKMRELKEQGRGPLVSLEARREASEERRRDFFHERHALGTTEERWTLIKAKLEEVCRLRRQRDSSYVGASLAGGPGESGRKATPLHFQWDIPWKNTPRGEVTEAQKAAEEIARLLARDSTTPDALRLKADALRRARRQGEADIDKRIAEARRELRELLTARQEAVLVLMRWL